MDQELPYEPEARFYHVACSSDAGQVLVWGGETSELFSNDGRIKLASVVQEFDPCKEVWCQRDTVGVPHPGLSLAACTSVGNNLFLYGGEVLDYFCGALSRLDMKTLTWSLLCPEAVAGGPMRKGLCGIVMFHGDKLAVIGGYGYQTGPTPPGSMFIRVTSITDRTVGHTNEHHVFNTTQGIASYSQIHHMCMHILMYDHLQVSGPPLHSGGLDCLHVQSSP